MIKFIGFFSLVGLVLPCLFFIAWRFLEDAPNLYGSIGNKLELLQLVAWPSSIFMMATTGEGGMNFEILVISITVNVILYAIIGFLIWFGLYKQRWVLFCTAASLLLSWYFLLTL